MHLISLFIFTVTYLSLRRPIFYKYHQNGMEGELSD